MKAQVWSMDFIASITVFILMFSIVVFSWNYVNTQNAEKSTFNEIQTLGLDISDILVRVPGNPEDWNESTVTSIGLATRENVLDKDKVDRFISMNYSQSRALMGLPGMDFYFTLEYLNGTTIQYKGKNMTAGSYPVNASISVPVLRPVLFGKTPAKLRLVIYV